MSRANRDRAPLAASLVLLGCGAVGTGLSIHGGIFLAVAGVAVVGIGFITLFSEGAPQDPGRLGFVLPKIPGITPAHVTWSGEGPAPAELTGALRDMGVTLDPAPAKPVENKTQVFTARMGPNGLMTNEDDLRSRGVPGNGLIKGVKNRGVQLGGRTLVELTLSVTLPGRPAYLVKDLSMVPDNELPAVASGLPVPVLVDPDDQTRLIVDWDA